MSLQWWRDTCREADPQMRRRAAERQDRLTKPRGSLGRLEQVAIDLAALQGANDRAWRIWVTVFAGDHGVVAEGISAYPQAVTGEMLRNFVRGGAAISVLARELGAGLEVVDLGTAFPWKPCPACVTCAWRRAPRTSSRPRRWAPNSACWRSRPGAKACAAPSRPAASCSSAARWASAIPPRRRPWPARCWMRRRARWSGREPGWTPAAWRTRPR